MEPNEDGLLTPNQEEHLAWLCTPEAQRVPQTKVEQAAKLGVSTRTLRDWEKKPMFLSRWKAEVEEIQSSPQRTQDLLDSLYEKGIGGDVKSAQLFLQATNRLVPQVVVPQTKPAAELTDVELDALILKMAEHQQTERKAIKSNHPAVLRLVP